MGDKTWAEITIHKDDYQTVVGSTPEKQFKNDHGLYDIDKKAEPDHIKFVDDQANYGKIESLEDLLQSKEIEYTLRWESGGDYTAGEEHLRWVDGVYKAHAIYDEDEGTLAVLKKIKESYDPANPEAMLLELNNQIFEYEPWEVKMPRSSNNSKRFIEEE